MKEPEPQFFASPAEFRRWLKKNHATVPELWVGFYKVGSGLPSLTWPQSVDEALCFGWIDGVRKSIDATSYKIRFTPRKASSKWSTVNTRRIQELIELKRIHPAGLTAFGKRVTERSGVYAYEQRHTIALDPAQAELFRQSAKAWEFFQAQPKWYRTTTLWWVMSAKKEETRARRLATLIADSEQGRTIGPLTRRPLQSAP